jgi:hypothetical protein
MPIRWGSAERLSLFHKEWAERRATVGRNDLMKKGLRPDYKIWFFILIVLEGMT